MPLSTQFYSEDDASTLDQTAVRSIVDLPRYQDPKPDSTDNLAPARGIVWMTIVGAVVWASIALLVAFGFRSHPAQLAHAGRATMRQSQMPARSAARH